MPGSRTASQAVVKLPAVQKSRSAPQLRQPPSQQQQGQQKSQPLKAREQQPQRQKGAGPIAQETTVAKAKKPRGCDPEQRRLVLETLTNPDIKNIATRCFNAELPDRQNGRLDFQQLRQALKACCQKFGLPGQILAESEVLFKKFDFNGDGTLSRDEFYELFVSALRRVAFDRSTLLGRDLFVAKQKTKVWDNYERVKKLGSGSFGAAFLCKHKRTGDERVVKAVEKSQVKLPVEEVEKEVMVMSQLDHPNLCRLYEWFEGSTTIYLVLDALNGGTLHDVVLEGFQKKGRSVKEDWIRSVMEQSIEAMAYCHRHRIIHKDLKDENIMLLNKGDPNFDEPMVVIIDLGVAEMFPLSTPEGKVMGGTPMTMAPEVWLGSFGPKCDVWSLGCVLYELTAGSMPFSVRSFDPKDWTALHKRGPNWGQVKTSDGSKSLCRSMLTYQDTQRPTMADCLKHKWFKAQSSALGSIAAKDFAPLQAFGQATAVKRALMLELAARLPMKHADRVVKVFRAMDTNDDGQMSKQEFEQYMKKMGMKDQSLIERTFQALDADGDGFLSFSELCSGVLLQYGDLMEDRFLALFRKHDTDCDGVVSRKEARDFLANALHMASRETQKKPDEAFDQLFPDGKDKLTYEEIKNKILVNTA